MPDNNHKQQSGIKDLIAKGREQGYLTYAEVNDHLPEHIADPEQVEDIIQMITHKQPACQSELNLILRNFLNQTKCSLKLDY